MEVEEFHVMSLTKIRVCQFGRAVSSVRTIILPAGLHGCETWSLTLREEGRLRVSENRVLRRIFEPKRDEVKGE